MAYLTVRVYGIDGQHKQQLDGKRVVLGRSAQCDILIDNVDGVSREHCAFICVDDVWFVEDLGTTNGTRVNNHKIDTRVKLAERDVVKVSKVRMTVHITERVATKNTNDNTTSNHTIPERTVEASDPVEAIRCPSCHAWVSVAHRYPDEHLPCPRCKTQVTVPLLIQP